MEYAVCRSNYILKEFTDYQEAKDFMLSQTEVGFYYLYKNRKVIEEIIVDWKERQSNENANPFPDPAIPATGRQTQT